MPSSDVGIMDYANRLPHEEGGASKFRMGGDPRFNIPEVLAQRQKLRESQRLKTASLQFWSVLDKAPGETMSKEEYTHVHQRIARALAPELSAAEAIEACEEDWEEDCGGMESISFEEYADGVRAAVCIRSSWSRLLLDTPAVHSSCILLQYTLLLYILLQLYALADMWTENVDELEYVIFLNKLFSMVNRRPGRGGPPSVARGTPCACAWRLSGLSIEQPAPLGPRPGALARRRPRRQLAAFIHAGSSDA